jgi:hypothetical protein
MEKVMTHEEEIWTPSERLQRLSMGWRWDAINEDGFHCKFTCLVHKTELLFPHERSAHEEFEELYIDDVTPCEQHCLGEY